METVHLKKSKYLSCYIRSLSENLSQKKAEKLEKWLAASSHNRKICDDLRKTWFQAESPDFKTSPDIHEEWSRLESTLGSHLHEDIKEKHVRWKFHGFSSRIWNIRFQPAMVGAFALVIVISGLLILKNPFSPSRYLELVTQHGERSQMILSDGSEIRLNSGSMARFQKSFSKRTREVFLTGEAFFNVTRDERPFVVVTENMRTVVLGTQFNVWARDGETRVIVKSGRVKISLKQEELRDVVLQKDQMCRVKGDDPLLEPQSVDSERALGWLWGKLVFDKIPLTEILAELERSYDVLIELPDTDLHSRTLTATFDHSSIDTVLATICLTLGTDYYFDKGRFVLTH
jgi:transmembrane sensor